MPPDEAPTGSPPPEKVHSEKVRSAQVRSEVRDYLQVSEQRRRLFPRALLVGLLSGAMAVAFRAILAAADGARGALIAWAHGHPAWGWILPMLFAAAGAGLSVRLVRHAAPEAAGSGIPHLELVLHRLRPLRWRRVLAVKFAGGALAIGSGMALGREGPTVQMGGAVGAGVAQWLKVGPRERLTLIAAGAGAGLAAAFNAPLAGLVFVLEEVQRDFRPIVFGAAFVAAAAADIVARFATGQLPVFSVPSYPVPALSALPAFLVLGLVAGLLGVVFNRGLLRTMNLFARARVGWVAAAVTGAGVGLIGWFSPGALGGGHHLAEGILKGQMALAVVPLWFLLRFVLTMGSYGCGAPGGIFAPLLVLGALIGLGVGDVTGRLFPGLIPQPEIFAVVGMAAYFAAVVRAPLTGIVLIVEMTGNYAQMLPLVVACFGAYAVADLLGDRPIYEALLERDLLRGGETPEPQEARVHEFTIQPGAPFAGKALRELGLPPGCIVVSIRDGGREQVPTAATRLEPYQRITTVIAPEAAGAAKHLREGCEPP